MLRRLCLVHRLCKGARTQGEAAHLADPKAAVADRARAEDSAVSRFAHLKAGPKTGNAEKELTV